MIIGCRKFCWVRGCRLGPSLAQCRFSVFVAVGRSETIAASVSGPRIVVVARLDFWGIRHGICRGQGRKPALGTRSRCLVIAVCAGVLKHDGVAYDEMKTGS